MITFTPPHHFSICNPSLAYRTLDDRPDLTDDGDPHLPPDGSDPHHTHALKMKADDHLSLAIISPSATSLSLSLFGDHHLIHDDQWSSSTYLSSSYS